VVVTGIEGYLYDINKNSPKGKQVCSNHKPDYRAGGTERRSCVLLAHTTQSKLFLQTLGASGASPFLAQVL